MPTMSADTIGLVVGAVLTLLVFSYLLGDNPLYRLALHLFVGALAGYTLGVVIRDVLGDMIWNQLLNNPLLVIPLVLGILLVIKGLPKYAYIGNFSVAYLVGVGTAVALGGALVGTMVPQIMATGRALALSWNGLLIIVGTVCTLMAFSFVEMPPSILGDIWNQIIRIMRWLGRIFLIVAFGAAFAGALTASLSIFIGRIQYLIDFVFKHILGS
jgi:hypothetical protein